MKPPREFKCTLCQGDFVTDLPEEEAIEEFEQTHNQPFKGADVAILCDDCFKALKLIEAARARVRRN